jgi:hypothetical protein
MARQSIAEQLNSAQVALDNARNNADILALLSEYMYDLDRLNEGAALLVSAQDLNETQEREYGEQFTATDTFDEAWAAAALLYNQQVALARVALKNKRGAQASLALDGRRKRTLSGWLEQANLFYKNAMADPSIMTELAKVGLSQAKIEAGWNLVKSVEATNTVQEKEKGEAQQATIVRDQALEVLDDWLEDFETIAGIALADQPQLLESLGFGPVPA